jgi:hypothetical protein
VVAAWVRHPLVRRLPLLIVVLAGLWLFRDRGDERELVWRLPRERADIERIELQLRDPKGALVQRSEFFLGAGPVPEEISVKLRLEEGRYDSQLHASLRGGGERTWTSPVEVRGDVVITPLAR